MPSISVVIPTWNGLEMLRRAVASLQQQTRPPDEILIVDNGSTDGTEQWISDEGKLSLVRFPENRGFAQAVNAGVRQAHGELIFVLNNDIECAPDCVEKLERAAAEHSWASWFAPRIVSWDGAAMECAGIAVRPDFFALPIGKGDRPENWVRPLEVFGASGGACLVRRSLFDQVGAFAEEFFAYYEDVDFAIRCRLAGYRCLYVPDAVVRHLGGATARRLGWKVAYLSARNQLWTLMRCCPGRLMASLGFKILRSQLANLAAAAIERHFLATLLGKIAALVGAAGQLRRRREIQRRARNLDEFRGWLEQPFREL